MAYPRVQTIQSGAVTAIVALACSLACNISAAQMFKCTSADGSPVFSDKPCGPDAKAHEVKPQTYTSDNDFTPEQMAAANRNNYVPQPDLPVVVDDSTASQSAHHGYVHREVIVRERSLSWTSMRRTQHTRKSRCTTRDRPSQPRSR